MLKKVFKKVFGMNEINKIEWIVSILITVLLETVLWQPLEGHVSIFFRVIVGFIFLIIFRLLLLIEPRYPPVIDK